MGPDVVLSLAREATFVALIVGGPILGVILVTGVVVSLVQAVTQIQEMTLTFIPKLIGVAVVMAFLGHWMLDRLVSFTTTLLLSLPTYAR
jgi:flagellar biosynthetic protein FliQ